MTDPAPELEGSSGEQYDCPNHPVFGGPDFGLVGQFE